MMRQFASVGLSAPLALPPSVFHGVFVLFDHKSGLFFAKYPITLVCFRKFSDLCGGLG